MTADSDPPRRRFQFRLRTLLIGVTLLAVTCAYVSRQAKIVNERKAMLETGSDGPVVDSTVDKSKDGAIPTIRLWLGDHFFSSIHVTKNSNIEPYKAAFPEADVELPRPPPPSIPW
jgi:hypothetical protein